MRNEKMAADVAAHINLDHEGSRGILADAVAAIALAKGETK